MRRKLVILFIGLLTVWIGRAAEMREWKDKKGNKVEAAFVKEEGGLVTLTGKDGKTLQAKMEGLCDEDCAYIREITYVPQEIPVVFKREKTGLRFSETGESKDATIRDTVILQIAEEKGVEKPDILGDSTWKIESVDPVGNKIRSRNEHLAGELTTEGQFVFVTYRVKNDSLTPIDVPPPVVCDQQGRKFSQTERGLAQHYIPEGALFTGPGAESLQPGFQKLFCSFYELPTNATPSAVEIFPSVIRQFGVRQLARAGDLIQGKKITLSLNGNAAEDDGQEPDAAVTAYGKTAIFMRCQRLGQSGDSTAYWTYDRSKKRALTYGVEMRVLGEQQKKIKVKAFFIGASTEDRDLVVDTKEVEVALDPGKITRATLQSDEIEEQAYAYYSVSGRTRVSGAKLKGVIIQARIENELVASWVSLNQWKKFADVPDVIKAMGELKKRERGF